MPNYISLADAAQHLARAHRILVIGSSGAGKTTLALRIADHLQLDYQSIDRDVRWLPGWVERARGEQRTRIRQLVARERWVMDGNGASSFDLRVPRADLIVWLRLPRLAALTGLAGRVAGNFGKVRVGMAPGCPERFPDRDFLSYIWNFEQRTSPKFIEQIDRHGPNVPVVILRSRGDGERLLGERAC